MKKIIPAIITFVVAPCGITPILFSTTSCSNSIVIEKVEDVFSSRGKVGHCWYRIKNGNINSITATIISNNSDIVLQHNSSKPIGQLVEFNVIFNQYHTAGYTTKFDIKFEYEINNNIKTTIIKDIVVKYVPENELEKKCNDYAEQNQKNFLDNLDAAPHDYYENYCTDFYCNSGAEACINWAHHPGYPLWSQKLHDGLGDTSSLDNDQEFTTTFDYPGMSSYQRKTRVRDYKQLDRALNLSTAGKFNGDAVHVYHGYEPDEAADLKAFVDNSLGLNIETATPSEVSSSLAKIIGKSYIDYSYLATSFDYDYSYNWAEVSTKFKSSIFLDLLIDEDVNSAYISYSRKQWYGLFLSRPENWQLLVNRKAKISVYDAKYIQNSDPNKCNIIYLYAKVSKQN